MAEKEIETPAGRPFILSIFCIALFVYSGVLGFTFLLAVIFNGWISHTVAGVFTEMDISRGSIVGFSAVSFLLNGLSFFSVYLIWNLKRLGLYLFSLSAMLFLLLPFFLGYGDPYSLVIMSVVIIFLFLHYRRLK